MVIEKLVDKIKFYKCTCGNYLAANKCNECNKYKIPDNFKNKIDNEVNNLKLKLSKLFTGEYYE